MGLSGSARQHSDLNGQARPRLRLAARRGTPVTYRDLALALDLSPPLEAAAYHARELAATIARWPEAGARAEDAAAYNQGSRSADSNSTKTTG